MTSKSPGDAAESPEPKAPAGAQPDPKPPAAPPPAAPAAPPNPKPEGTAGVHADTEALPGRPAGEDLGMAPMDKSAGPYVVPPAQTNAAEDKLSRAETRPAGRAAPEPDAADEPGGGGDPGDVHPKVAQYEAEQAKAAEKAEKESKK